MPKKGEERICNSKKTNNRDLFDLYSPTSFPQFFLYIISYFYTFFGVHIVSYFLHLFWWSYRSGARPNLLIPLLNHYIYIIIM